MPCALIGSITQGCNDSIGGIKEIKLKAIQSVATVATNFTVTSGDVVIAAGSRSLWYRYYIEKETATMNENANLNIQNGTVFYQPELRIVVNKLRAQMRNEFEVLGQTAVQIAVKDYNNNHWLLGKDNGMDLTCTIGTTGAAREERSGYELRFTGKEPSPVLSMTQVVYDTLVT